MIRKLLFVAAAILVLVYGTGHSFGEIRRTIVGASEQNARGITAAEDDLWGDTY